MVQKISVAILLNAGMLRVMDWQAIAALGIVAATAALFAWQRVRPRRFRFERETHCGCSTASLGQSTPSITYRARKGEAPTVVIRAR